MDENKSAIQQAIESQFEEMLKEINERFSKAGDQMAGLSTWMRAQLQIITDRVRKAEISQGIIDISSVTLHSTNVTKEIFIEENEIVPESKP